MGRLTGTALAEWVAASCAAQGLALKITDVGVVSNVVVLLSGGECRGEAWGLDPTGAPASESPFDADPPGVEARSTGRARCNHDEVNDRRDDCVLPGEVQVRPLAS